MPSAAKHETSKHNGFDPRAVALLKHWLSVSESQICSLEVLCAQVPEVSKLLETSMCDISERFVAMASDFEQYAAHTKTLAESLNFSRTKSLELDLEAALQDVALSLDTSSVEVTKSKIEQLIIASQEKNKAIKDAEGIIEEFGRTIQEAISRIIVDMQFQDRVSQNLVIVVNVLNAIITYLQEEIDTTITSLDKRNERAGLDKDFAQKLMKLLTLGELQHRFMDHLVTHHYISDYAELGYDPNAHPDRKAGEDNVDLF